MKTAKEVIDSVSSGPKENKTFEQVRADLGCTPQELSKHLELLGFPPDQEKFPHDTALVIMCNVSAGHLSNRQPAYTIKRDERVVSLRTLKSERNKGRGR